MPETTTETTTPGQAVKTPLYLAQDAASKLRDGINAIALLVYDTWNNPIHADRARNSMQWIAEKMGDDFRDLDEALDNIVPPAEATQ